MIRHRSDEQVLTSAAQMDEALDDGLPADLLLALTDARDTWHRTGRLSVRTLTPEVTAGLAHPAATTWDEVFVTAGRRRARELSVPLPTVPT